MIETSRKLLFLSILIILVILLYPYTINCIDHQPKASFSKQKLIIDHLRNLLKRQSSNLDENLAPFVAIHRHPWPLPSNRRSSFHAMRGK